MTWVYPLPDWVKPGARVRCVIEFALDDVFPGSSLVVCEGARGRVLSVDDKNVRVYLGPCTDLRTDTPEWVGQGDPVEPYRWVEHMRGDFDGLWAEG